MFISFPSIDALLCSFLTIFNIRWWRLKMSKGWIDYAIYFYWGGSMEAYQCLTASALLPAQWHLGKGVVDHPPKISETVGCMTMKFLPDVSAWNKYFASDGHRVRQSALCVGHLQIRGGLLYMIYYWKLKTWRSLWPAENESCWSHMICVGQWSMTGSYFMHWIPSNS